MEPLNVPKLNYNSFLRVAMFDVGLKQNDVGEISRGQISDFLGKQGVGEGGIAYILQGMEPSSNLGDEEFPFYSLATFTGRLEGLSRQMSNKWASKSKG